MDYQSLIAAWFDCEYAMRACCVLGAPNVRLWLVLQQQQLRIARLMVEFSRESSLG